MPCGPLQASGSNADIIFAEEDCLGTFQQTVSAWQGLRATPGESLQATINRFESNELSPERAALNTAGGNIRAGGGFNFELAPEGWGTIMKHLLAGIPVVSGSVGSFCHTIKAGNDFPVGGLSIEKRFNDINKFIRYWGGRVDNMSLNFPQEGYITGSATMVAKGEISDENASNFSSTYGPSGVSIAPAAPFAIDEPFVTYSSVIQEGNPLVSVSFINNVSLNISNSFEQDGFVIGSRYRECITPGKRSVTGTMQVKFLNLQQYNKFLEETRTALRLYFQRGTKSIEFLMPRIEFTGETPKIASSGGLPISIPFRALYDSTEQTDLKVTIKSTESAL